MDDSTRVRAARVCNDAFDRFVASRMDEGNAVPLTQETVSTLKGLCRDALEESGITGIAPILVVVWDHRLVKVHFEEDV